MVEPTPLPPPAQAPASPAEPAPAVARVRGRPWSRTLIGVTLLLSSISLIALALGGLFWAAGHPGGSAWLLRTVSAAGLGIEVHDPQGTLIGDLQARQIVVTAGGTRIVIDNPSWRGLSVEATSDTRTWGRVHIRSLTADRVAVTTTPSDTPAPTPLPDNLRIPLQLRIDALHVVEAVVPGLQDRPLRDVRSSVWLSANRGTEHRVDGLSLRLDPLQLSGHVHIGSDGDMRLDGQLQAVQVPASPGTGALIPAWAKNLRSDWRAELKANGPLARFQAEALLRAQGQSLDARALVAPADTWPLPELDLTTQNLDLSAFEARAPMTALSGQIAITPDAATAQRLNAKVQLTNTKPGRWDEQQLPVRSITLDAQTQTDALSQIELSRFDVQVSNGRSAGGSLQGRAHWNTQGFALQAQLNKLQPADIDARLAAMTLSGPINVAGTPPGSAAQRLPTFNAQADLSGQLVDPPRPVQFKLDASGSESRIEIRQLHAAASGSQADLTGTAQHQDGAWQVKSHATMLDFDPRPWLPSGPAGGWPAGPYRLSFKGDVDATLADSVLAADTGTPRSWYERLAGVRGDVGITLDNSVLAGVNITGDVALQRASGPLTARAALDMAGNRITLDGRAATDASGRGDQWTLDARAPELGRIASLLRLVLPASLASELTDNLSGSLQAETEATGRWPEMTVRGNAKLSSLRAGPWAVGQGDFRWSLGSTADAPLDVQATLTQAAWGHRQIGASTLSLTGSPREHLLKLRTGLKAAPPAWMEGLQGRPVQATVPGATPAPRLTMVQLDASGSLRGGTFARDPATPWSWKGTLAQLDIRNNGVDAPALLHTANIELELTGGDSPQATVSEGRAEIVGAALRWNRIDWRAGQGVQTQQLDMNAELEPLAVAEVLQRVQPNFGWGGDLQMAGRVVIRQTDTFSADIVLERTRGDLTVTEESGTQALGLSDLRIGMVAQDGVWSFTAGLAGKQLGVLGGALVVRTSPQLAWPEADAPVQGVLEAQVANLGTWGSWVPAGWRLEGKLNVSASLGGRFNAPEYTGEMRGSGIGVRNMLEGVNLTDGEVDISLHGASAKINKFSARGGNGTVRLEGDATLDDTWRTNLRLVADKFQLLGRVDLRIVTSGEAQVSIHGEDLKAEGRFVVDEGLIDFTRLNSPGLGDDVVVVGRTDAPDPLPAEGEDGTLRMSLDLRVGLGEQLRMRGLGLDTLLRGDLRVSRPEGKWDLQGTVNTVDGTFANYGQKLVIDRGVVNFAGAPSDMRLDIEATRPNLDVRVGVKVTGLLQNLRVRLFSEPDMSNNEKLSWLLLGRESDGLGQSDMALVQRAAFALLAGDGDGGPGGITKAIGIDDVGVRQSNGDTRETVVSVGKQLSDRVYLAYEQNLNTSSGSFQVTYRIARRFVMRLQSGFDRSIDLVGTWRWD